MKTCARGLLWWLAALAAIALAHATHGSESLAAIVTFLVCDALAIYHIGCFVLEDE